jgi:hypothetical protein
MMMVITQFAFCASVEDVVRRVKARATDSTVTPYMSAFVRSQKNHIKLQVEAGGLASDGVVTDAGLISPVQPSKPDTVTLSRPPSGTAADMNASIIRSAPIAHKYATGGVSLCGGGVENLFKDAGLPLHGCHVSSNCNGTYPNQLAPASLPYLSNGQVLWSQEHSDKLVDMASKGQDISPHDYPHAFPDFTEALRIAPINGSDDIMVGGSVSPWLEAALKANGAKHVFTMDYGSRKVESDCTQIILRKDLENQQGRFGSIVSFSSVEHDGLGRYCDPVNPDGDLAAMMEFRKWLKPGGTLYLGIPVGAETQVQGNNHRIYGQDRFAKMTRGFSMLGVVNTHWGHWSGANWQNQPWFVLKSV